MKKESFDITGMTCSACANRIEKNVKKVSGVHDVSVNLLKNTMVASYDESVTNAQLIIESVEKSGYSAAAHANVQSKKAKVSSKKEEKLEQEQYKKMKKRLISSLIFTIPLFYISMGHMLPVTLP